STILAGWGGGPKASGTACTHATSASTASMMLKMGMSGAMAGLAWARRFVAASRPLGISLPAASTWLRAAPPGNTIWRDAGRRGMGFHSGIAMGLLLRSAY